MDSEPAIGGQGGLAPAATASAFHAP
jgi:hypothetical protein